MVLENDKDNARKANLSGMAVVVGWLATLAILVWTVSAKDSNYDFRIAALEKEVSNLDSRIDASEAFRTAISTDLAEIKTDLLWIRRQMDQAIGRTGD